MRSRIHLGQIVAPTVEKDSGRPRGVLALLRTTPNDWVCVGGSTPSQQAWQWVPITERSAEHLAPARHRLPVCPV